MEYHYAVSIGKPIVGFFHEDTKLLPSGKCEDLPERREALVSFRDQVRTKLCRSYSSAAELGAVVSRAITQIRKTHPTAGWVRAETLDDRPTVESVLSLKAKIEDLEAELGARRNGKAASAPLAEGDDPVTLTFHLGLRSNVRRMDGSPIVPKDDAELPRFGELPKKFEIDTCWNELFEVITSGAPRELGKEVIADSVAAWAVSIAMDRHIVPSALPTIAEYHFERTNYYDDRPQLEALLIQFCALDLFDDVSSRMSPRTLFKLTNKALKIALKNNAMKRHE
jgi:hypothetical protein